MGYMVLEHHAVAMADAEAFEVAWLGRESTLAGYPGLRDLALLRAAPEGGACRYLVRMDWHSEADHVAWQARRVGLPTPEADLPQPEARVGYAVVGRLDRGGRLAAVTPGARSVVDLREALRQRFEENADGVIEALAAEHGLTPLAATRLLPATHCRWTAGAEFEAVMAEIATWGEVLFLVHTPSVILEVKGVVPPGESGRGFFNLHGESPIGGHLRACRCTDIAFVRRPFMGLDSASVQFFDEDGAAMFKIYVGRKADRSLDQAQLAAYEAAALRFAPASRQAA